MDYHEVDALAWVRAREGQLFATGHANAMGLVAYLVSDVLELGRGACHAARLESWWLVSSDVDWMSHPGVSVPGLFERVVTAPEHGDHSLRAEVLLAAFARDVLTGAGLHERLVIKGTPPGEEWARARVDLAWARRYVLFSL